MTDTVDRFVAFMKAKWRSGGHYRRFDGSHYLPPADEEILDDARLKWEGSPDTEGYAWQAIDFGELCRQIDEFAAELKKLPTAVDWRPFCYADNFDNWWNGEINDAGEVIPHGTLAHRRSAEPRVIS